MEVIVSPEDHDAVFSNQLYTFGSYPILRVDGERITLHKFIANRMGLVPGKGELIDHENRNKFDARRENLRILNHSQNNQNKDVPCPSASGFRGVYKCVCGPRWQVYYGNKRIGYFDTAEEGARAYDKYIIKFVFREGITNFKYSETEKNDIVNSDFDVQVGKLRDPAMKGVYWKEINQMYEVRIKGKNIGRMFKELDEAQRARDEAYKKVEDEEEAERLSVPIRRNDNGQAIIPLTGKRGLGKFALVDDELWHELMKSSWNLANTGYPQSRINNKLWSLHEYLFRNVERDTSIMVIDHYPNTNTLDNRMCNLRVATRSENAKNLSDEARKKISDFQRGTPKPKHKRKNIEDNELPKYLSSIRTDKNVGYQVQGHPLLKRKIFTDQKLTMSQKLELALEYLRTSPV